MNSLGKLEPLFSKYAESTGLRAIVALIPYIGGALDILMASEIQKKTLERYQKLINEISDQMKDLDEKMIDHTYLESDEFYDLFIQISNLAVKTRLQEKVKAYASILTSSFTSGFKNRLNPEDILNIIEDLTENDIYLIKLIAEYQESDNPEKMNSDIVFSANSFSTLSAKYSEEFMLVCLLSLVKNSLIIKHPVISAPIPRLSYSTTPLFEVVKNFLTD